MSSFGVGTDVMEFDGFKQHYGTSSMTCVILLNVTAFRLTSSGILHVLWRALYFCVQVDQAEESIQRQSRFHSTLLGFYRRISKLPEKPIDLVCNWIGMIWFFLWWIKNNKINVYTFWGRWLKTSAIIMSVSSLKASTSVPRLITYTKMFESKSFPSRHRSLDLSRISL